MQFDQIYHRDDLVGQIARKYLYGPDDIKNKVIANVKMNPATSSMQNKQFYSMNEKINRELNNSNFYRVRLSMRCMANYKFILYFFLAFVLVKLFTGCSFLPTFFIVGLLFMIYTMLKRN
jgi:hypothetical protein